MTKVVDVDGQLWAQPRTTKPAQRSIKEIMMMKTMSWLESVRWIMTVTDSRSRNKEFCLDLIFLLFSVLILQSTFFLHFTFNSRCKDSAGAACHCSGQSKGSVRGSAKFCHVGKHYKIYVEVVMWHSAAIWLLNKTGKGPQTSGQWKLLSSNQIIAHGMDS